MPDQVERFTVARDVTDPDGQWVRYSAYEKLEEERDKLEDMLEQAKGDFITEGDRADKLEAELREAVKQRDEELRERLEALADTLEEWGAGNADMSTEEGDSSDERYKAFQLSADQLRSLSIFKEADDA